MFRQLGMAGEGLRLIRDEEFTSRFLPVGQPEVDELIGVYNRMVDHLREERVRLAEQHQFLSQVLQVSPSGVVDPGLRSAGGESQPGGRTAARAAGGRRSSAVRSTRSNRRWRRRWRRSRPGTRASSACSAPGA